jgi:hypothetical protein
MLELRRRLGSQKHELYVLARALRAEDQTALRSLLAVTPVDNALVPRNGGTPSNESLLLSLVKVMRRIRQLEKQFLEYHQDGIPECHQHGIPESHSFVTADDWSSACALR